VRVWSIKKRLVLEVLVSSDEGLAFSFLSATRQSSLLNFSCLQETLSVINNTFIVTEEKAQER